MQDMLQKYNNINVLPLFISQSSVKRGDSGFFEQVSLKTQAT